jgi:hypothetical protein
MSLRRSLQFRANAILDNALAEPVYLIPWLKAGEGYSSSGALDPNRTPLQTRGLYTSPGADLKSLAMATVSQVNVMDFWLSIAVERLNNTAWAAGDIVYWPERLLWSEISRISPSSTGRPEIFLLALPNGQPPGLNLATLNWTTSPPGVAPMIPSPILA